MASSTDNTVITDVTISFTNTTSAELEASSNDWSRIDKDLYLRQGQTQTAWLHVQSKEKETLEDQDWVVTQIAVQGLSPGSSWEQRPLGMWILRGEVGQSDPGAFVTDLDVLFGTDAVDPRPGWTLGRNAFQLDLPTDVPLARLTVRHGTERPKPEVFLTTRPDGMFKIVQISDLHFGTGPGICEDAIDASGRLLAPFGADPASVEFVGRWLDIEKPDLVVLAGDQSEFGKTPDTQTAIFKYTAPLIHRCIPFAVVFGNHDDEGPPSLPRAAQMALLQSLPFCVATAGPDDIDGVGNYCLQIAEASSQSSPLALFFLDSHNRLPVDGEVYDWIKQSQIDWFSATCRDLRKQFEQGPLLMAFIHIPLLEYNERDLVLTGGQRREEVMSPQYNSHFYDALAAEGVAAISCGHDHVNDYCALRPAREDSTSKLGPWLCYGGGSGFGGYGGYGGYHRRVRVFDIDTKASTVVTWKRAEYCSDKVDELVLVEDGVVVSRARRSIKL
ncbi:hypothetical protein PRZ48_005646 [Zasmidium cellare]|uniref:Calcineurin-like phosphoesterase domain-containing protein n=1 Tax=Zasmidium cellare TaxID=395010 RepID=A0ABR0EM36_ZASCE|nr:hypothetical protein PRZ48_005646 [Zasmidium cellare]